MKAESVFLQGRFYNNSNEFASHGYSTLCRIKTPICSSHTYTCIDLTYGDAMSDMQL